MTPGSLPDHGAQLCSLLVNLPEVLRGLGLLAGACREANGRRFKIRCPWHLERTPSCAVDLGPKEGTLRARCFSCGQGGDVLALLAAVHGLDLRRDYQRILDLGAELAGISLDRGPTRPTRAPAATSAPRPPVRPPAPPPQAPLLEPADFARGAEALLTVAPLGGSVAAGMALRGVLPEAQADGWGVLPMASAHAALVAALGGDPSLAWLVEAGTVRHPEHRLLIPWRAPGARIWTLQRRYAPQHGDETPPKGGKYLLPDSKVHRPEGWYPYGADAAELASAEEVWLVEGAVDVLAVRALNARGLLPGGTARRLVALGLPGVASWPQVRDWTLAQVRGRAVFLALDADRAGEEKVQGLSGDCYRAGAARVRRQRPGSGFKDWADATAARLGACPRESASKATPQAPSP